MSKYLHVAVAFILAIATATSWGGGQNRPPSVTLTAPANGATFTAPASITLTANASDSDGISQVDFYQGAMLLGTSKVAPYTVTWTNVPGGSYSLTARAFDKLGASATSAAISVTVSGAKVTVTSPANGATVYGDTVSVEGTFSGDAGTTIWIDNGNSSTLATQNGSNFSASVPLLLGPNTLNISVVRRDKTTDSTSLSFNGGNAPKIAFKLPETTAFEAPANIAFEVDAVSPTGTINRVEFLRDGALVATISSPPYRHVFTNQPPGSIQVTARAVDNAGNASYLTPSYIVVNAANALPTVNLTFPAANTVWQEPANITLTASASDTDGSISMVEFFQDGALLGSTNISPYSFALTNVTKGSYTYTARATDDRGGATTSAPVSITVTQPNALPTVTLTSPKDGDVYRVETEGSTAAITLEAVASDSDGTIAKVEFFQGSTLIGATTTAPYAVSWNNAGPGTHVLTVKVTDNLGATTSATVNVTVTSNETITYLHNDFAGNPLAATDINGAIVWKENYRPYGERLSKQPAADGNRQWFHGKSVDSDTGLSYFGARYYDTMIGRFVGIDPVGFDPSNTQSFNRYAYANNNPYKFVDPDGRSARAVVMFIPVLYEVARKAIYAGSAAITAWFANKALGDNADSSGAAPNTQSNGTSNVPPVPSDYVGDQSDPRAGTSNSGKRHTSGPLSPDNGGTGDAQKDFDHLTGGTGKPFPGTDSRSKNPGSLVGDNGIWIRPGTKKPGDGPRIEIPGNGNKLPETLHY